MKTPDEIKRGLECCRGGGSGCSECPYNDECRLSFGNDPEVDALVYIQELEARVPNWISVEDRLPERGERVMFIGKEKRQIYVGTYRGKGGGGADHFMAVNRLMSADWWMPLPEPPKEEV